MSKDRELENFIEFAQRKAAEARRQHTEEVQNAYTGFFKVGFKEDSMIQKMELDWDPSTYYCEENMSSDKLAAPVPLTFDTEDTVDEQIEVEKFLNNFHTGLQQAGIKLINKDAFGTLVIKDEKLTVSGEWAKADVINKDPMPYRSVRHNDKVEDTMPEIKMVVKSVEPSSGIRRLHHTWTIDSEAAGWKSVEPDFMFDDSDTGDPEDDVADDGSGNSSLYGTPSVNVSQYQVLCVDRSGKIRPADSFEDSGLSVWGIAAYNGEAGEDMSVYGDSDWIYDYVDTIRANSGSGGRFEGWTVPSPGDIMMLGRAGKITRLQDLPNHSQLNYCKIGLIDDEGNLLIQIQPFGKMRPC